MYDTIDQIRTTAARAEEAWHRQMYGRKQHLLKSFPVIKQFDSWTCGVQCVYAILRWFNRRPSFDVLIDVLGANETYGTGERSMRRVLARRKFRSTTLNSIDDIFDALSMDEPIIALVDNEEHWLVIYGFDDDSGLYIADSSRLKVRISKKKFKERWSGRAFSIRRLATR